MLFFCFFSIDPRPRCVCCVCHVERQQKLASLSLGHKAWSLKKSMFAPRIGESDAHDFVDSVQVLHAAFEADWRQMKVGRLIKNDDHRSSVKQVLKGWCVLDRACVLPMPNVQRVCCCCCCWRFCSFGLWYALIHTPQRVHFVVCVPPPPFFFFFLCVPGTRYCWRRFVCTVALVEPRL